MWRNVEDGDGIYGRGSPKKRKTGIGNYLQFSTVYKVVKK